ncbi:MAG: hypothetical protein ABSA59_08205 [Terriglobia bacterium]
MLCDSPHRTGLIPLIAKYKLALLVVLSILAAVLGFWGAEKIAAGHPVLTGIVRSLSAALFISGTISVTANFLLRRDLAAFWLDAIGVRESIRNAGLEQIALDFNHFDFAGWFQDVREVDVWVIHADYWLGTEYNNIRGFLSRAGTLMRFCVLGEKSGCVDSLEESFQYSKGGLEEKISRTVNLLQSCAEEVKAMGKLAGRLMIYKHDRPPKYTYYRFDEKIAFVPYRQAYGKAKIPVFVFRHGGKISDFLEDDFSQIINEHSTLVYDSAQGAPNANG